MAHKSRFIYINDDGDFQEGENNITIDVLSLTNIGGGRIVTIYNNFAEYADNINNYIGQLGISTHAANAGDIINIMTYGFINDPSWSFNNGPIYLKDNGLITQIEPVNGASVQVGWAKSPNSFFVKPNKPIER